MDPITLHRKSVDAVTHIIESITLEQLTDPTNLEWDVRGLLNHILGMQYAAQGIFAAGTMSSDAHEEVNKDFVGNNIVETWKEATDMANKAIAGADLEKMVSLPTGNVTGAVFANMLASEVFIHGWDLAHSTKQDDTLDPEVVEAFYMFYEPQRQMLRESGAFGDKEIAVSADADRETQLLAILGRQR